MTDNLGRLAAIIKARTPGPWHAKTFHPQGAPGLSWRVDARSAGDIVALGCLTKEHAAFIAALGSCADELMAVVRVAEFYVNGAALGAADYHAYDALELALAALDARLAAVLPGGEP